MAPLRVGQDGINIGRHETGKVVERAVERKNPAEARAADRQIPPFAALRAKQRELPFLEAGAPFADRVASRREKLQAERGVGELGAEEADRHQRTTVAAGHRRLPYGARRCSFKVSHIAFSILKYPVCSRRSRK